MLDKNFPRSRCAHNEFYTVDEKNGQYNQELKL